MMDNSAIVVVTYRRNELLQDLFASIVDQATHPAWIVVVDNGDEAAPLTDQLRADLPETEVVYTAPGKNLGGAGGFALGVETAMNLGAEWLWFMDDDVVLLPDAGTRVEKWAGKHRFFIGRRQNRDGSEYFYQPKFSDFLAIPLPDFSFSFDKAEEFSTDVVSFEGCVLHRSVVETIGPPDARFFLSWDDIIYGWLAAQHTPVVIVTDFLLRRTRENGTIRFLGRTVAKPSPLYVFHFFKNRRIVKEYFRKYRRYHPIGFRMGTAVLVGKELYRGLASGAPIAITRMIAKGLLYPRRTGGVAP